jgi:hypothetical protein
MEPEILIALRNSLTESLADARKAVRCCGIARKSCDDAT